MTVVMSECMVGVMWRGQYCANTGLPCKGSQCTHTRARRHHTLTATHCNCNCTAITLTPQAATLPIAESPTPLLLVLPSLRPLSFSPLPHMANSVYEYVRTFELSDAVLPQCWMVAR